MCAVEHWAGGALAGLWLMANRMAMVSLETDGFFGFGFYTRDKASGVITTRGMHL